MLLAGCASAAAQGDDAGDPRDTRDADAVGSVTSAGAGTDSILLGFAPDEGYEYFEGTVFDVPVASEWPMRDADMAVFDVAELEPGDRIAVWTGPCAESFPVQCQVEAVEVLDH